MTERAESDRIPGAAPPDLGERVASPVPAGASEPPGPRSRDRASVIISAVLAVVFVAAFVNALQWEAIAGLFPLTITGIGAVLSLAFLARCLTGRAEASPTAESVATVDEPPSETAGGVVGGVVEQAEEAEQLDSEHAFFASLERRDWFVTLGWFAGFFVVLSVAGLYIATVLFTGAYLRHQARASWTLTIVYAVVLAAVMYALFGVALQLPVPQGVLGPG